MLKLLGGLLIFLGAAWWGLEAVGRLRQRTQTLEGLRGAFSYLEEELTFRLTPLPKLLEYLGRERSGAVGLFFRDALQGLRQDPEGGLRASWRRAMVRRLDMLKEEERELMLEVGESLGRFDAKAQRQVLLQAAKRLETLRAKAQEEAGRLGRVYAAVSLAGGAALILVLL